MQLQRKEVSKYFSHSARIALGFGFESERLSALNLGLANYPKFSEELSTSNQ
jgi:hypothetical protein